MSGDVVALIPARSGSKGVSDKNVRLVGGRPLIHWSVAAATRATMVDRVIVSTDSKRYAELALDAGAEVPFLRPAELATDESQDLEFIVHALDWLSAHGGEPERIVHLRPTTPFRDPQTIDAAIQTFLNNKGATALRSVHEMSTTAYKSMEITTDGLLRQVGARGTDLDRANDPRQSFPKTFQANGYVDVLTTAFIRSSGLLHGDRVLPFLTPLTLEIDSIDDFDLIEYHLNRNPSLTDQVFR